MAEEWRVSLIFDGRGAGKGSYFSRRAVCGLLRSRVGDDIVISAVEMHIFVCAGTAEAAAEAEQVAREVLAEQNLSADVRFERWNPSGQAWRDARAGAPDRAVAGQPDAHEEDPEQGRLPSTAAALIGRQGAGKG